MRERLTAEQPEHVSTSEQDPTGSPVSAGRVVMADLSGGAHQWPQAAHAALLTLGNFAAVALMLAHLVSRFQHDHNDAGRNVNFLLPSDLATPLVAWVWFLCLTNGLILVARRQTRATGIGIVVAAAVIAVPVVAWVVWTFATFASG